MNLNQNNLDKLLKNKKGGKNMEANQNDSESLLKNNKKMTQAEIDKIIKQYIIKLHDDYYEQEAEMIEWKNRYITNLYKHGYWDDYSGSYCSENYYNDDDIYSNYNNYY